MRGLYNTRKSTNQAAPEPIFLGPGAGTGGLADNVGVDVTNPYNTLGFTLNPDPVNGNLVLIGRRPIEGGPRIFRQSVDTSYFATGLEGSFSLGERDFYWDVNLAHGDNSATQTVTGTYNIAHIQRALGPIANCTDSCVPLNIFGGPGTITPAMLQYIQFVKALDLSGATRYSDYSTFGGTTNSKLGLRWQLFDDLTLRSTVSQGFRAPSIGELFGSPARFDATLQDPCSAPIGNSQTASNCAALGVPAGYTQPNPQISIRTGGNTALQPETSRNLTYGAVYSPSWASNTVWASRLDITAGYYRIKISNSIQALDPQTKLNRCVDSGSTSSEFCTGIHRNATGNIDGFDATLQNLGKIDTHGWDFGVNWRGPESAIGVFRANLAGTVVGKYVASNKAGNVEPRTVGLELNNSAIPRLTSNLDLGWSYKAWDVSYKFRYISALREDCASAAGYAICNHPNEITPARPNGTHYLGAVTYQDVRATWKLPISLDMTVTAGVNNVWDKKPPICVSCSLNGYDASTYDTPSRFMYVQASVKF